MNETVGDFCIFWKLSYILIRVIMRQNRETIFKKSGLLSQKIILCDSFVTTEWYDYYKEKFKIAVFPNINIYIIVSYIDRGQCSL